MSKFVSTASYAPAVLTLIIHLFPKTSAARLFTTDSCNHGFCSLQSQLPVLVPAEKFALLIYSLHRRPH